MQGETIPIYQNHISLDGTVKDAWGIPQLRIDISHTDNDWKMRDDFMTQAQEMLDAAGCKDIKAWDIFNWNPGLDIHEIGCRMGKDPRTSVLNQWNPNSYLTECKSICNQTDLTCMTSVRNQNRL